jgi:Zn-dependent protease with chaperone function
MGQLIAILLAVGSLGLDDLDATSPWRWPFLVPVLALVPYLLAQVQRRAGLSGGFRRAASLARLAALTPVLSQYIAVGVFGWQHSVEEWLGTEISFFEWPGLSALLVLAPFLLYSATAIDAEARLYTGAAELRSHMRRFQLRMLAAGLAPIIGYLALASVIGCSDVLRLRVEEVGLYNAGFTGLLLLSFIFCLPFLLQHTWDTERLVPGGQRSLLEHVASRATFRCKELVVWRTGGLVANAAIVGVTPGTRRVFFSDALLARLGPRELAAVFAHEIGHARRHHVPLFVSWALTFFAGLEWLSLELDPEGGTLGLVVLVSGLGLWLLGFGWLSRRVELEADLYALELLGDAEGLVLALDAVAPGRPSRSGWRHFSMAQRVDFLERAQADRGVGRQLRRRLSVARWLGALALLTVLALQGARFVGQLDHDLARSSLRLGRYASSALQLGRVEQPAEDVAELVRLAYEAFPRDFEDREEAARACRQRALELQGVADPELVQAWWFLASLAGDRAAQERLD